MDILDIVLKEKNFKYALWSREVGLNKIDFLFDLFCASLQYDYKNTIWRYPRKGDTVELTILNDEHIKKLYFIYDGEKEIDGIQKIQLKNNDIHDITKFSLKASQYIWRLNKCNKKNQRLTSNRQLKKYNLLNLDISDENPIRILASKANIPYEKFNFFERTSILMITQSNEKIIGSLKEWKCHGHSFLDYFPAYFVSGSEKFKKINSDKNDRSEPERILYIFSNLAELLDFINEKKANQNCFIISDSYSRLFNIKLQQYFLKTLLNPSFKIKLLYFGNLSDFKRMNKEDNIIFKNKYIEPIIIDNNVKVLKNLKSKIQEVGDKVCNELIIKLLNYSKKNMDINPNFAGKLRKIIFNLCSLDKYETDIFKNSFEHFCKEYKNDSIIIKLRILKKNVQDNNYKQINRLDNLFVTDYSIINKKNVLQKKELKENILNNKLTENYNYVICFFSPYFFNDFLFPAILLGYISTNMISFRFYSMELKVFNFILKSFLLKYKEFIVDQNFEEDINEEDDNKVSIEDVNLFEFDFSFISHYLKEEGDKKIDAVAVELEDDKNEYIAFFSKNYSPTIVTPDSVFDTQLEELEIGDELLFLPGVRNVLQQFSEIFEKKEFEIHLRNKWKEALKEFENAHSFDMLVNQLKRFGINRTESTIRNWINNSSVIGTSKPHEDFQKIAVATNNNYLKHNYKQVADVCVSLQKISKILGKRIKKFSIAALRGTNINTILEEYEPEIQTRIEEVVNGMKIVTVTNMDKNYREIDSNLVNQLLEKEKVIDNI